VKLLPLILGSVALAGCTAVPESPVQVTTAEPHASVPAESVEALQVAYQEAATKYESTNDEATKSAYVNATVSYATAVMTGPGNPEKYRKSLKLFDEALRLDPDNEEAKVNRQLILDIYKSMGKEPPK
jgi:hypothetical protein